SSLKYLIHEKHLDKTYLDTFNAKSALLRSYFIDNIQDRFEIVQSGTEDMNVSNFIAVRPRDGFEWKEATINDFWKEIRHDGVDLTVIPVDGTWWLRISFPYFLQLHLLKQLIKHLNDRVSSVN